MTSTAPLTIFYDGTCGLCHRSVSFIINHDKVGRFRFSPIGSNFFSALFSNEDRELPVGTLLVVNEEGKHLIKSDAVLFIARRLSGAWPLLGNIGGIIPRILRDSLYDVIARNRFQFFKKPNGVCPIVSPEYQNRFLS